MHQTSITLDEFADLVVDFEVSDKSDFGGVVSMTGHHPDLGPVTAVQDGRNVFLLTERPLAYSRVPDTHSLETAIAWMTQTRSTLQAVHNQPSHGPKSGLESIPRPVRGMLTWLGIDPLIATSREVAYAREIVAHAEEMAALPPAKLAELRAALLSDLRELAA
jgi:hypothetical protein